MFWRLVSKRNVIELRQSVDASRQLLSERVELDAFMIIVSPMDRHGWFTFVTVLSLGNA